MNPVAIIPARGGSKRLPGKNILPVMGKPALYYPVRSALASGLFDRVIVSTEDDRIKENALRIGAEVVDRPAELAGDDTGVVRVCVDVIRKLEESGCHPALFCCIYATAVFITPNDLQQSYGLIRDQADTDMVMGVSAFNLHPVQALESTGGYLAFKWKEYMGTRSQLHPKLVASNGTLYWARTTAFLREKSFYGRRLKGFHIPWIRAVDMDTPEDYETVQQLAPLLMGAP